MLRKFINYGKFLKRANGVLKLMDGLDAAATVLVPDEIERTIDAHGARTAFLFEGENLSFDAFDARANTIAHWAIERGLRPGDNVALVMENCPDYPAVWFGLSKVGVSTSLINYNLEGAGLAHCINVVESKIVIVRDAPAARVAAIKADLKTQPEIWDFEGGTGENLSDNLAQQPKTRPDSSMRAALRGGDTCIYIYTSGTTGLPKAARITHSRFRRALRLATSMVNPTPDDVVYNVLPLYHMTGGGLGIGATLFGGATTCIRRKFSASEFWEDVAACDASLFVYIGEFGRYLLNTPIHPKETTHRLRAGFGNGLRADVWQAFTTRFNVPSMQEFYGSTEGNVTFINLDGKVGSVGQSPALFDNKLGIAFVKFDVERETPIRNAKGYCVRCGADEIGEVLGRISTKGVESFEGYHDKKATEKKILTDVFQKGDKWFRTGDLMRRDAMGYVYFVDRIGDTFRWKGENVATNEVSDVLAKFDGVEMANVYGVEVPGTDGRAGMAAITTQGELNWSALVSHLRENLPPYAMPIFLRIQKEVETTGTFKFRKVDAVKDGFDIRRFDDPVRVLDIEAGVYSPLTPQVIEAIHEGKYRF